MISENQIFCLACHQVAAKEKAGRIFRTGYYKCAMRLGVCQRCHDLELRTSIPCADCSTESYLAAELL